MRPDPRQPAVARTGGFTLIELLVATLIVAGIAGAASVAVSQALRARSTATNRQEALSRAGAAADRIASDVENTVRSGDLFDARVLLVDGKAGDVDHDELLLFSHSWRQARAASEQNEGGTYEIQYRLQDPPEGGNAYVLWRRLDPVPDAVPDGGGVAAPIVSGMRSLAIEAFDGEAWYPDWDSDRDGYPHALRVTAIARAEAAPVDAAARRTIAFDRTPVPIANLNATVDTGQNSGSPSSGATPSTTGATGGDQRGGGTVVTPPRGGGNGGGRPGGGGAGGGGGEGRGGGAQGGQGGQENPGAGNPGGPRRNGGGSGGPRQGGGSGGGRPGMRTGSPSRGGGS